MSESILLVAREFTGGGAAFLILRHVQRLGNARPIDLLITGPVCPVMAGLLPDWVTLAQLETTAGTLERGLLATRDALVSAQHPFLEREYSAVLGTSLFPDMAACAAFSVSRARRKVLVLLDEGMLRKGLSSEERAAIRGAFLAADHLVPVSQSLLAALSQHEPLLREIPATVLHPPIDDSRATGLDSPFEAEPVSTLPRVVTVARLSAEKQLAMCLRAHRALRNAGIDFHWHVVGEGKERRNLERSIAWSRMEDRFHLEGFLADSQRWIRHADLFVLASRSEGCPTVIRQALAEGTPTLCTDVHGARELVTDGVTGLVIPNCEGALVEALGRLVREAPLRASLRQALAEPSRGIDVMEETRRLAQLLESPPRARGLAIATILIPTYNQEQTLGLAIQSALMQDCAGLEVVVCDDASTDRTEEVARRWSHDPRLRIRRNAVNLGRVANYHQGVEREASGEWVLMLDGDDHLVDPEFLSLALRALTEHSGERPVFAQAGHRVVWRPEAGHAFRDFAPVDLLPAIAGRSEVMSGADYLKFVYQTGFFTHLGTLYSREAARRHHFYTKDINSSDMDSLLRLALSGQVVILKTIAGCWVQHGGNTSSNLPLDRIEENVRIFRQIAQEGAAAGRLDMRQIERCLTRYEARTMAYLFGTTIGKSSRSLAQAAEMIRIMFRVNPGVFLEPTLVIAWCKAVVRLTWLSVLRLLPRMKNRLSALRDRLP